MTPTVPNALQLALPTLSAQHRVPGTLTQNSVHASLVVLFNDTRPNLTDLSAHTALAASSSHTTKNAFR